MTKSLSNMYRDIVQSSIQEILGNEALWLGMQLWDKHFSDADVPSIKDFSFQLCTHLECPELHGKLYTILLSNFFLLRSQASVAAPEILAATHAETDESDPINKLLPSAAMFIVLIREIFSQLNCHPETREHNQAYTQPQLRSLVAALPITIEQRAFWASVLLKGEIIKLRGTSDRELKKIFHQIYLALAESFGPVEADQSIINALQYVERLPIARSYSPHNFL